MPNIEKEAVQQPNNMLLLEAYSSKQLLQNIITLDRILTRDFIRKAYRHQKDIATDELFDSGKKELIATGRQQETQLGLQQESQH